MLTEEGCKVVPTANVLFPFAGVISGAVIVSVAGDASTYQTVTGVPFAYCPDTKFLKPSSVVYAVL